VAATTCTFLRQTMMIMLLHLLKPMSHLRFYRAILSRYFIVRQRCSMQLCMSHTATLSQKQELANQRSPHFATKLRNQIAGVTLV